MKINNIESHSLLVSFFTKMDRTISLSDINNSLQKKCGIVNFFETKEEFLDFFEEENQIIFDQDKSAYGDFQTNEKLTLEICNLLKNKNINPEILIEPTCGKGGFILSAIKIFPNIKQILGIEIFKPYLFDLKLSLLEYFLKNPTLNKPIIHLFHCNIFDFNFQKIKSQVKGSEVLVIGNPPWVTNSTLSCLESNNFPKKSNFKQVKGIDAITGKGNFDIGEYVTKMIFDNFSTINGHFAFLVKSMVIKNIVYDQKRNKFPISEMEKHTINSQKEFGASVDAALFYCTFNSLPSYYITEYDFYSQKKIVTFGWLENKFSSHLIKYELFKQFDGICPFEWRQGIKHDCSKIMELERVNGFFVNGNKEQVSLEEDLIYGLLKSSDLKGEKVKTSRKYTIITQKKVGQETKFLLEKFPKTKRYLFDNKAFFEQRKSSIYKGKPQFSIFGIGDYSFKPYKVAISGLYKQTFFTLIEPNSSVLMLDDTCYFIGFEDLINAKITQFLLNKHETQSFLQSLAFSDSKRMITKDLLMRIDLKAIALNTEYQSLKKFATFIEWENFLHQLNPNKILEINFR